MNKSQWYTTIIIFGIILAIIANLDTSWSLLGIIGLVLLFVFVLLTRNKYH